MTGPLPQSTDRLTKVRVVVTSTGAFRVRYRLNGKRRSSCAFPTQELAQGRADSLHEQFPSIPAAQADTNSAPTVQGDEHDQH